MTTFFPDQDIIEIHPEQLSALKKAAAAAPLRRARLCLHQNHADEVQEMVIAFCRDTYNRPHRHRGKSESFHVIEGQVAIVFFDEEGRPTRQVHLGMPADGLPFLYRLASDRWHAVIPLTDHVIIHETTTGPFVPGQTEFAPWSPDGADVEAARQYVAQLERSLAHAGVPH
jgi:cupin fold WbuC family metalloprotein